MIVTKQFVYIHMPKTGGTFVTEILKRLYGVSGKPTLRQRVCRRLPLRKPLLSVNKHGYCGQIPPEYSHLPIVGCVRNPLDRYVSQYSFAWWKTYPDDFPELKDHPSYPDLSFEEFVHLANEHWLDKDNQGVDVDRSLGWHTIAFVNWYCRNAEELLRYNEGRPLTADRIRESLYTDSFLRTNRLNRDLHDYLHGLGLPESKLEFILESPKIMPREGGRTEAQKWEK